MKKTIKDTFELSEIEDILRYNELQRELVVRLTSLKKRQEENIIELKALLSVGEQIASLKHRLKVRGEHPLMNIPENLRKEINDKLKQRHIQI